MGGADTNISKELIHNLDIISPNATELKRILRKEIDSTNEEALLNALKEIRQFGENEKLCLLFKRGSKGSIYIDANNKIYKQEAITNDEFKIVDTTGAGNKL